MVCILDISSPLSDPSYFTDDDDNEEEDEDDDDEDDDYDLGKEKKNPYLIYLVHFLTLPPFTSNIPFPLSSFFPFSILYIMKS